MALKICHFTYSSLILVTIILRLTFISQALAGENATTQLSDDHGEMRSNSNNEDSEVAARSTETHVKSVPYFQASLPMRIYECLRDFSILRCTKLFVLQKMEERKHIGHTGNLTRDFLDQFFDSDEHLNSLINNKYTNMTDERLNQCLVLNFQRFFKHRDIKLHFLPGIMVKIVPSRDNKLSFMLKKSKRSKKYGESSGRASKLVEEIDEVLDMDATESQADETADTKHDEGISGGDGGGGDIRRKNKKDSSSSYKSTILQMAVPVMVMPAILMGTILPFLLPVLKMATIMTMMMNNSAFIAALIYAARTHANAQEEQHISYPQPGHSYY